MAQDTFVLLGAGRSAHTRQLRRDSGFQRRTPWIGSIQIKPNQRREVGADFIKEHFDEIVKAIESGVLLIETAYDSYVDPEELKGLIGGAPQSEDPSAEKAVEPEQAEPEQATVPDAVRLEEPVEFKPLPEDWRNASRHELAGYCEERGIVLSDVRSSKEAKRKLEEYVNRGG